MLKKAAALLSIFVIMTALCACSPAKMAVGASSVPNAPTQGDGSNSSNPKIIRIASLTSTRNLEYVISAYKTTHPEVTVEFTNFDSQLTGMKQSATMDLTPMIQSLYTQIMSGSGPDIIMVNDLPFYKLVNKGGLADISAMMTSDKSFDSSLYYTNIFDACKTGGKMYAIPTCFSFYVLSCKQQFSPGSGNVTMQQFLDKAATLPANVFAFAKDDPLQIVSNYLQDSFCTFVDYGTHTASFNSPEFINTIKAFKELFDTKMSVEGPQNGAELEQQMNGTVAYSTQTVRRMMDICMAKSAIGKDAVFTNVPTMANTNDYTFISSTMLAINANSRNQDTAWEFIKAMLSQDAQTNGHPDGFPVLKSACQAQLDSYTNKDYMLDKSGNRMVVQLGNKSVEVNPLSVADAALLTNRFEKLNRLSILDDSIIKIIMDELPPFFAGQKSAVDVANLIQNRVNTVLNE